MPLQPKQPISNKICPWCDTEENTSVTTIAHGVLSHVCPHVIAVYRVDAVTREELWRRIRIRVEKFQIEHMEE